MAIQTFIIEVRVDFEDESKNDIMATMARASARELLTTAMMLKDKAREPQVALQTGNMFETNKELLIAEEEAGNE